MRFFLDPHSDVPVHEILPVGGVSHRAAAHLDRIAFRTSRLLDFVGRRELTAQIGHEAEQWPLVIVKELADNALDACEEAAIAPEIEMRISTRGATEISVADNGLGIAAETVSGILDYSARVSSREAYVSPTRGAQGNALKTIVAMPFALDGQRGETVLETRGISHRIVFTADQVRQEPKIEHRPEPGRIVSTGTRVTVRWPNSACWMLHATKSRFLQMALAYAALNPHLSLRAIWDDEVLIDVAAPNPAWQKWRACDPTSPHWYDLARLTRYAAAIVSHDQDRNRERTVREFISEFRGLSGSARQKAVLDASHLSRLPLSALFPKGEPDQARITDLLSAMCVETRPVKPKDLGALSSEHLRSFCVESGVEAATFRYRLITGESEPGIPFVLEAAFAAWLDGEVSRRSFVTGINFSPALGNPFRSFGHDQGLEALLAEQHCGADEPVLLVLHLTSPRTEYRDRGKTALVLPQAVIDAMCDAVRSVTGPWAKQRKAEERDRNRAYQRRARLAREGKITVTIKDAAWHVMPKAYFDASTSHTLPAHARQVMYAARREILRLTGKKTLNDDYFTQTLLPDYLAAHPKETADWDVVFDERGTFSEPHTGRVIGLGTVEVRQYLGERPTPETPASVNVELMFPTVGPLNRYRDVLFIEKEGFSALITQVRLAERFDIAVMSTKGMSTTAARMLIDGLMRSGVTRVFVLHDFDWSGFSIFGTLGKSNRRYRFENEALIIDIGLRLVDIQAMHLDWEEYSPGGDWEKRAATLASHGATQEEIKRIRTERVELNALSSGALVQFIERKLIAHGVRKVVPKDDATLEQQARRIIIGALLNQSLGALRPQAEAEAACITLPSDLRQQTEAALERQPDVPWDLAVAEIARQILVRLRLVRDDEGGAV